MKTTLMMIMMMMMIRMFVRLLCEGRRPTARSTVDQLILLFTCYVQDSYVVIDGGIG